MMTVTVEPFPALTVQLAPVASDMTDMAPSASTAHCPTLAGLTPTVILKVSSGLSPPPADLMTSSVASQ